MQSGRLPDHQLARHRAAPTYEAAMRSWHALCAALLVDPFTWTIAELAIDASCRSLTPAYALAHASNVICERRAREGLGGLLMSRWGVC
jgi:hypothetical protein